jgi:hypothetical protein
LSTLKPTKFWIKALGCTFLSLAFIWFCTVTFVSAHYLYHIWRR